MGKIKRLNYHGYLGLLRHNKLVLHELGHLYFGTYMGLVLEATWDRAKEDYGCVVATNKELEMLFGTHESTISRHIKLLTFKRYVVKTKGIIKIIDFPLFELSIVRKLAGKDFASMQELRATVQELDAKVQEDIANMHDNQLQNTSQSSSVSSKVNLSLSQDSLEEDLNLEEIDKGIEQMIRERGE